MSKLSKNLLLPTLGRVRTHIPGDAESVPSHRVDLSDGLSRLRRYMSGNCTFVTFRWQGNQSSVRYPPRTGIPFSELVQMTAHNCPR